MSDTALVIMARYPQKGMVKTRLARSIGDERTLQLYQAFLIDLAHRFAGTGRRGNSGPIRPRGEVGSQRSRRAIASVM